MSAVSIKNMLNWFTRCNSCFPDKAGILVLSLFVSGCVNHGPVEESLTDTSAQTVWPAPPEQPRIRFLGSLKTKQDVTGKQELSLSDRLLGKEPQNQNLLNKPYGVHSDSKGRVFVADSGIAGLMVFDLNKNRVSTWGESGPGSLKKPIGVTSDALGNVYVSDVIDKRVVKFDNNGQFVTAYGGKDAMESPAGLVFNNADQRLYLVDVKKHQILVINSEGKIELTIGKRGTKSGEFNYPTNIAVDASGEQLYVADSMNFRIQILKTDGTFVRSFGKNGNGPGSFSRLKGVGVDMAGHIYAVDAAFNNFQILDQEGQLLLAIGRSGIDPGGFYLPAGAHVDRNNKIFIADQYNQRIQMFEYLELQE